MKRVLMALAVVAFMAGSLFANVDVNAVPSSGFRTLVYTVTGSMKGCEFTDASAKNGSANTVKANGFVVFDVNTKTLVTANQLGINPTADSNAFNNETFIILGRTATAKKAFAIVRNGAGAEGDANTVVMDLAAANSNDSGIGSIYTTLKKNTATATKMTEVFFEVRTDLLNFVAGASVFAKLSNDKATGLNLPRTFSMATGELNTLNPAGLYNDDDLVGSIKFSLNTNYTKKSDKKSVKMAVDFITADLVKKGYKAATIQDMVAGM